MDDDRDIRDTLAGHAPLRLAVGALATVSATPDRLYIFLYSLGLLLRGHDGPSRSRVDLPHILRMAFGIQSVRRVGVLECHGRPLYTGPRRQTLRCDCRRRQ